jgi:hypothetical protein
MGGGRRDFAPEDREFTRDILNLMTRRDPSNGDSSDAYSQLMSLLNARELGSDEMLHARGLFSSLFTDAFSLINSLGLRDVSSEQSGTSDNIDDFVRTLISREPGINEELHARNFLENILRLMSGGGFLGLRDGKGDTSSPPFSTDDLVKALLQK